MAVCWFGAATHASAQRRAHRERQPIVLPYGDVTALQVFLDRQGFSPGEIDGTLGPNLTRALKAFQSAKRLAASGTPDCDTWRALGGDGEESSIAPYRITAEDVKGPFTPSIPRELPDQASLPSLSYRSALELLAERFHASPRLLQQLNAGAGFQEGDLISVPAVTPFILPQKPAPDPAAAADIVIEVSGEQSAVRAMRADGTLVFFAPVTSGSTHDPLPPGDWQVRSVSWNPVFNYNPDLFWDADPTDVKATIPKGPNNPVGVVWIGLDLEHYGLHGTPEPSRIGHTASHGCVRLTNWDAARLASLVRRGTLVRFR